jgi:methyltransferase (TIGR00027 family)
MKPGVESQTAERVALRRALHQLLDRPPVFVDPLAVRILPPHLVQFVTEAPHSFDRGPLSAYLRAFFAVRSRFAEDELHDAVARGVRQYVVLGAGYDTFAYRNPFADLRVFEVDHPATQASKRARLAAASIAVPDAITFVPVDFATATTRDALLASGFDASAPAFVSWLGVLVYLDRTAIDETLALVASLARGTTIVFDYGVPPEALGWRAQAAIRQMERHVASIGEPWKTYLEPAETAALLKRAGFSEITDFGAAELTARYLSGRDDSLRLGEAARLARARV